jgi:putative endonuclease
MCVVYIIYSKANDQFYIGQTVDLAKRIHDHNRGIYIQSFTKQAKDWDLYFSVECDSKTQAIKVEQHIKRMKSRKYYLSLKQYPLIIKKLKLKYK